MKKGCSIACCTSCGCFTCPGRRHPENDPGPAAVRGRRTSRWILVGLTLLALAVVVPDGALAQVDTGVIRLSPSAPDHENPQPGGTRIEGLRRGFDYEAFTARLESLWFQRKALLADGRRDDAARQAELIRSFCVEEGVKRLTPLAGALVAEADRFIGQGNYDAALDSMSLAATLDPGRPQLRMMRARVYWKANQGYFAAGKELLAGLREAFVLAAGDLSLLSRVGVILVIAALGCVVVFSLVMLLRYQVPFRHEVEEWVEQRVPERWARSCGWAVLFLPLLLWFTAGWTAFYWIAILFRFMRRTERATALVLLIFTVLSVPLFGATVTLYGMTADPLLRATLAATDGQYAPDRVIHLRRLVDANPDNPTYRFLLAGLYKNGRFFEEAFDEYKQALQLHPSFEEAHVNLGNIFFTTGQHAEALANYRRALEINPRSVLALYNSHLAQSESFRFTDAEASLQQARSIDSEGVSALLAGVGKRGQRAVAIDASLQSISLWNAAMRGASPLSSGQDRTSGSTGGVWRGLVNPIGIGSAVTLAGIFGLFVAGRRHSPARRCVRCGSPFCRYCKSAQKGREYCNQCMHLFVLGDGLSPDAKRHKGLEVLRHERRTRLTRRLVSLVLPGSGHMLQGRAMWGCVLLLGWFGALVAWNPIVLRPVERLLGMDLRLDLLRAGIVSPIYTLNVLAILALASAVGFWLLGNLQDPQGRRT